MAGVLTRSLQSMLDVQVRRRESNEQLNYHSEEAELLRTTLRYAPHLLRGFVT